tara:strand:+ start:16392 stop:16787 length:396 start_codon:yes stop_codon:yes gene_type:complete
MPSSLRLVASLTFSTGFCRDAGHETHLLKEFGGASTLVDDILANGYAHISVLDLSGAALATAKARVGAHASDVQWLEADILDVELPTNAYDVWHDRAVFHFLTSEDQRHTYVKKVLQAVKPGGLVIVATFA